MTQSLKFDLVTPEKLLSSDEVEMVVVPGAEGDMGVLAGHAPVISNLRPGVIRSYQGNEIVARYLVAGGVAEITNERCTVLATEAYDFANHTREAMEKRLEATKKLHQQAKTEKEKEAAQGEVDIAQSVIDAFIAEADNK